MIFYFNESIKIETSSSVNGEPGVTRTPGPLLRRQMLYPTELQAQKQLKYIIVTLNGMQEFFEIVVILLNKEIFNNLILLYLVM